MRTSLSIIIFLTTALAADFPPLNAADYCVTYFGGIAADLTIPDRSPNKNYNGTASCPPWWRFHADGAKLRICPPTTPEEGNVGEAQMLDIELYYASNGNRVNGDDEYGPITAARLSGLFITNDSATGPFGEGLQPAKIELQKSDAETINPAWSVNGTQESFLDDYAQLWLSFDCQDVDQEQFGYCGNYYDRHWGGCWSAQSFELGEGKPVNYSVRFEDEEAELEIWIARPWIDINGTDLGEIAVKAHFAGDRELPSITEYDFWENSETSYEGAKDDVNDIKLKQDATGMPMFFNETAGSEWYSAGNGTYFDSAGSINVPGVALAISSILILLA